MVYYRYGKHNGTGYERNQEWQPLPQAQWNVTYRALVMTLQSELSSSALTATFTKSTCARHMRHGFSATLAPSSHTPELQSPPLPFPASEPFSAASVRPISESGHVSTGTTT